jgi:hypothetical protein
MATAPTLEDITYWDLHESPLDRTPFYVDAATGNVSWVPPVSFAGPADGPNAAEDDTVVAGTAPSPAGSDSVAVLRSTLRQRVRALARAARKAFPAAHPQSFVLDDACRLDESGAALGSMHGTDGMRPDGDDLSVVHQIKCPLTFFFFFFFFFFFHSSPGPRIERGAVQCRTR